MEETIQEITTAPQYGRVKGASWFSLLHKRDILVLGQGGIGSWVSLLLSRIGANLHIFDMDTYEAHNMSGQLVAKNAIGMEKVDAVAQMIAMFSPDADVEVYGKYDEDSITNDIVICGFDNMAARKTAFNKWKIYLTELGDDMRRNCFFQDGRLLAEQLQIISIPGDRADLIEKYEKEYLFEDEEVQEADCTFKQTSHCAAMIASHMVGFLTNWAVNSAGLKPPRVVPFFYEHYISLNLTNIE